MNRRTFTSKILQHACVGTALFSPLSSLAFSNTYTNISMHKPKLIKPGDTIGLVAPGSAVSPEKFELAVENMKKLNLKIKYSSAAKDKNGYLAANDKDRLNDLHNMFADREVDAIWCLRGGYGSGRLLPFIDYKLIKQNPKVLIGYSDMTALLLAIFKKTGLIGFHGPMATSTFTPYAVQQLKAVLMEPKNKLVISHESFEGHPNEVIREGKAKGCLIGGNLSLLASLVGTPYEMKVKNKIIFIEDIGEKPYRIDRMLTQLLQSHKLKKAAGIALGVFKNCESKVDDNSWRLIDTFKDRLYDLGIPIYYGLPFGHVDNQCTLPIGIKAELDATNGTLTLLESAVKQ